MTKEGVFHPVYIDEKHTTRTMNTFNFALKILRGRTRPVPSLDPSSTTGNKLKAGKLLLDHQYQRKSNKAYCYRIFPCQCIFHLVDNDTLSYKNMWEVSSVFSYVRKGIYRRNSIGCIPQTYFLFGHLGQITQVASNFIIATIPGDPFTPSIYNINVTVDVCLRRNELYEVLQR